MLEVLRTSEPREEDTARTPLERPPTVTAVDKRPKTPRSPGGFQALTTLGDHSYRINALNTRVRP